MGSILRQVPIPGSKNVKADALSRIYDTEEREGEEPPSSPCPVSPRQWCGTWTHTYGRPCTRNPHLHSARTTVHTCPRVCGTASYPAPVSGHPGISHTIHCLTEKYWWPTLARDDPGLRLLLLHLCPAKDTQTPPVWKAPSPAGSTMTLVSPLGGLVTDLPLSQGNTTILIVVDRFSKAPMQTAQNALYTHVFRHYGMWGFCALRRPGTPEEG